MARVPAVGAAPIGRERVGLGVSAIPTFREIIPFASMRVMKASPLQVAPAHRSAAIDHPE